MQVRGGVVALLLSCTAALATAGCASDVPHDTSLVAGPAAIQACIGDRMQVIGHRGIGVGTPVLDGRSYTEDTIPAFRWALAHGADGFETDFQPTRDGVLVSLHDGTFDRTTTGTGRVADRTIAYVRGIRADSGARIPTFEDVVRTMAAYDRQQQQELKNVAYTDAQLRRMVETDVRLVEDPYRRVLMTAGEIETLRRLHRIDPQIRLGWITREGAPPAAADIPPVVDVVLIPRAHATAAYVDAVQARGIEVSVRGVETIEQLRALERIGVRRVVTDVPALLAAAC